MKHTIVEIVKGTNAHLNSIYNGILYYTIVVEDSTYQLEINSKDDEWKNVTIYPVFKTITLMRWIRQGIENGNFIQIK